MRVIIDFFSAIGATFETVTPKERFWKKVLKSRKCWIWQAARNSKGYGVLGITAGKYVYAHRFSWEQAHGPIPAGLQVNHKCDNPLCVRPGHLWLGTQLDNILDAQAKGRIYCSAHRRRLLPKTAFTKTADTDLLVKLGHLRSPKSL